MDLKETNAAARAEGQSYGMHVAQSGPQVEVTVPPGLMSQKEKAALDAALPSHLKPEAQEEPNGFERVCPQCGKTFLVITEKSRKKYCSPDCLKDANYQRYKQRKAKEMAESVKEGPVKTEKQPITFGDILNLLGRDSTEVTLYLGDDNITGSANSRLWQWLEPARVENIGADEDGMSVWLKESS